MKGIAFILEGTVNTGLKQRLHEHSSGAQALQSLGYEVTAEAYNELYNEMKLARSDAPAEGALWQVITTHALMRGWDERQQSQAWHKLLAAYQGFAGYAFVETPGLRSVIEEIRFGSVDNWGDVPQIVAITNNGAMARDALEQARLMPLFDHFLAADELDLRISDPRLYAEALEACAVPANHAICVGSSLSRGLAAAKLCGMDTLLFAGDDADAYPPRGPWETPDFEASDDGDLGDVLMHWLHSPPRRARKSQLSQGVSPSTRSLENGSSNGSSAGDSLPPGRSEPRTSRE